MDGSALKFDYGRLRRQQKEKMKKGIHPQLQWISYVTQSGRLMNVTMTKIHQVGKVYHFRAKRQMAQSIGQIAKFKRRYGGILFGFITIQQMIYFRILKLEQYSLTKTTTVVHRGCTPCLHKLEFVSGSAEDINHINDGAYELHRHQSSFEANKDIQVFMRFLLHCDQQFPPQLCSKWLQICST
ncbi:ribosomal protein L31 [Striga asiatica]|uniref:Ribosomal protein L31 n=1 Tax=Striga asiatica TaxID=4170 RepID=A0A5A7P5I4_STRAF|nr:ribosomal protein L31 [Striga asiatica]